MKKRGLFFCIQVVMVILFVAGSARAAEWRFPVGLTYVSGFGDLVDILEDNKEAEGYSVDSTYWPVGISFHPYFQFDNGCGIGAGVGPIIAAFGDIDFWDVPINLDFRYTLLPSASVSPYARVGVRYHIADGDYVEGRTIGFFGGVGVEFLKDRAVSVGIEVSYDASEIEMEKYRGYYGRSTTEDIKPCEFMVSVFAVF